MAIFSNLKNVFSAACLCACAAFQASAQAESAGEADDLSSAQFLNQSRLKLCAVQFENDLKKIGAKGGALCIAKDGKILFLKTFPQQKDGEKQSFALGKTSSAIVSLAAVAAQENEIINLNSPLSRYCSYFRLSGGKSASLEDLLRGNKGFDEHSDTLIPRDSSAADVFDFASQLPVASDVGISKSLLSSSVAGYALGYIADKSERDFKKSFVKSMHKFVFIPLEIDGVKYRSFDSPFFPATALAFTADDIGKWLCAETSPRPKIATASAISARRAPAESGGKFGMGWIKTSRASSDFFMCGDYFQNCATLVAAIPQGNIAVAFAVRSDSAKLAPKVCADALERLLEMLKNPIPAKKQ